MSDPLESPTHLHGPEVMIVYTDSIDYATHVTGKPADHWAEPAPYADGVRPVIEAAFDGRRVREGAVAGNLRWGHLLLVERARRSHYDALIELSRREGGLADGVLMLAGSGEGLHGYKGRAWAAEAGNIHLAVHVAPRRAVERPGTCFTVLAALSVVEAADAVPGLEGRAGIKWVNDVLVDGAKVGGVLAYTHVAGDVVGGAVLGIGLDVEKTPEVPPTPFVPRAGALRAFASDPGRCTLPVVLGHLVEALDRNYRALLAGGYPALVDRYRRRSLVLGREVSICTEDSGSDPQVTAAGRVTRIGDDLALTLEGFDQPFTKGRLILE